MNTFILQCMHDGRYLITAENYNSYLEEELQFYSTFDHTQLNNQEDFEDDYAAAELMSGL